MVAATRLVILDLDGVLVEARRLHFDALNEALVTLGIEPVGWDFHLASLDGLPTLAKLDVLDVDPMLARTIDVAKSRVFDALPTPTVSAAAVDLIRSLRSRGIRVEVVTNGRRATALRMLGGLERLIDRVRTPDDGDARKPAPAMLLRAMAEADVGPDETVVVEDSPVGRRAARASGASLMPVSCPDDVPRDLPMFLDGGRRSTAVVVPMAGRGARFAAAGHVLPKPLIDVDGVPMIAAAVACLRPIEARFIFLVLREHLLLFPQLERVLLSLAPDVFIAPVDEVTDGAARTVLLSAPLLLPTDPVVVMNCDQLVDFDADAMSHGMTMRDASASVLTFRPDDPNDRRWSFADVDPLDGVVRRIAEKDPIGPDATCGVYLFSRASLMIDAILAMIAADDRTNGELYLAPALNRLDRVVAYPADRMIGLGTPEDLERYHGR